MTTYRVNNSTLLGGEVCAPWAPNHAYSLAARCVCRTSYGTAGRKGYVYECTTAGTSHAATEPTWPTSGTVTDGGTLVWTARSPGDGNWDNASCYLGYVLNYGNAGSGLADASLVYISHAHSESSADASALMRGATSRATPIKIYSVNKASDALLAGAIVNNSTQFSNLSFNGFGYAYGVTFSHTGSSSTLAANGPWILESNGALNILRLNVSGRTITTGGGLKILNGNIQLDFANGTIGAADALGLEWKGGALVAPNGVTSLFNFTSHNALVQDVDLSALGNNALRTVGTGSSVMCNIMFVRCKMPAAYNLTTGTWGGPHGGQASQDCKLRLHHCGSANTTYELHEKGYCGTIDSETTIVRTGGASDGVTGLAMKMISTANVVDGYFGLESPAIESYTDSATTKTFTIELIHDSATALQDDEVWVEVEYPANNTDGLGAMASSRCAPLTAAADTTSSAATWTTTGMANPNARKLSVTITPGKKGPITAKIFLAKPSTTVYIDPMITES